MHAGTKSYNASFNKEKQQIQIGNLIISRKKKWKQKYVKIIYKS